MGGRVRRSRLGLRAPPARVRSLPAQHRAQPGGEGVRVFGEADMAAVHDAVGYMLSEEDLRRVVETAFVHCRPGGIAVLVPDDTAETFEVASDHGGTDAVDGRGARYLEWSWDPDPADTWILTAYTFLLRDADGTVRAVHETHRTGLFGRDAWLRLLADAGFEPEAVIEQTTDDRTPCELFIGHRPLA